MKDADETISILNSLLSDIIDIRIPIRIEGKFKVSYPPSSPADCKKIGRNKKLIKSALANNRNLYIRTDYRLNNPKK